MNVLGAQHSPVDEADATLRLWGWGLCGESGTALVQTWPKVDGHHDTDCQQDKESDDHSEQRQPVLSRWFSGPTQHLWKLPLRLLPR